jgi:hypothetical protein
VNIDRKDSPTNYDVKRLERDVRTKFMFAGTPSPPMPELHTPNPDFTPDEPPPCITNALHDFEDQLEQAIQRLDIRSRPNLSQQERERLKEIRNDERIMVMPTDKNLGPVVLDTETYIDRALTDHLLNTHNYQQLTAATAHAHLESVFSQLLDLTDRIADHDPNREEDPDTGQETFNPTRTYFKRFYRTNHNPASNTYQRPEKMGHSNFYIMPKVHKKPKWQTRPVVSQSGSLLEPLARWVDKQLQKVVALCPCYFRDSKELQHSLEKLGQLPADAVIFSADAKAMYCNIDTDHALWVLRQWFRLHEHELPADLAPLDLIMEGLELIMRNTTFTFGNTWWKQLCGTAMGTSPAPPYAIIYFSYHEETRILNNSGLYALRFYARFIDDAALIQFGNGAYFDSVMHEMNAFGEPGKRLEWEATEAGKSVDFLDLTITIQPDGRITTQTYQKPMNLYLYLPPTSAHSPSIFKGMIYGMLLRHWEQNSDPDDFCRMTELLYERLRKRGHNEKDLQKWFRAAGSRIDNRRHELQQRQTINTAAPERLFFHTKYHPSTLPRQQIHQLFNNTCRSQLEQTPNAEDHNIGPIQLTIAYSRRENIRDLTCRNKLRTQSDHLQVTARATKLQHEAGNPTH